MIRCNAQLKQEIMQAGYSPACRHSEKCSSCNNCNRFDGVQILDEEPKVAITLVGIMKYSHSNVKAALFTFIEIEIKY